MQDARVTLVNPLGLHMRASAKIVKLSAKFESKIAIVRPSCDRRADARSILSILELGAKEGTELLIEVDGDDETTALSAVIDLIRTGFGEI
jgi:phosphotransferase system HPr (HPr) family protein